MLLQIIHALPGRLRLELPNLYRNFRLAALLEERLIIIRGIINVRARPETGRLLIRYSTDRLTPVELKKQISHLLSVWPHLPSFSPVNRQGAKENRENKKEFKAFELESLSIGRQLLLTGASGTLLLYTLLKRKYPAIQEDTSSRLLDFDTVMTILTGYPIFDTALEHLLKKGHISSEFLAGAATLTSLAIQESHLGLLVVWLVYLSTLLRTLAMECVRHRIRNMIEGRRPAVRVQTPDDKVVIIPGNRVAPGAVVIAGKGERLPVDGCVCRGAALVNQCPIKGTRQPERVVEGETVYAGSTVVGGKLYVKAERVREETYIGRIIQLLIKNNPYQPKNNHVISLMNKVSFLSLAASAGIYLFTGDALRAVAMLVVGTPGAAGMASSLSLETVAGRAAERGVLIKDGRHMERVARADTVLFDKTTLLSRQNNYDLEAVKMLRDAKIPHIGLLTGEPGELVAQTATRLKMQQSWSGCRPADKLKVIRRLQKQGRVVIVVGEEADDIPALSAADVGITMSRGSELNFASANIVVAGSDPRQVAWLYLLARRSQKVARQNIIFTIGANILGLSLGILNVLSSFSMALLQNAGTFAIFFNTGRLLLPIEPEMNRLRQ